MKSELWWQLVRVRVCTWLLGVVLIVQWVPGVAYCILLGSLRVGRPLRQALSGEVLVSCPSYLGPERTVGGNGVCPSALSSCGVWAVAGGRGSLPNIARAWSGSNRDLCRFE